MAYEMVMPYHLHMPSYFLETFTEYPMLFRKKGRPFMIGLPFSIRIHTLLNFPAKGFCYGRKHNLSVYNIQAVF